MDGKMVLEKLADDKLDGRNEKNRTVFAPRQRMSKEPLQLLGKMTPTSSVAAVYGCN